MSDIVDSGNSGLNEDNDRIIRGLRKLNIHN